MIQFFVWLFPFISPFIAAGLAYRVAIGMERRKEIRAKYSAATLLQAELIRLHRQLKNHHRISNGYAHLKTGRVDAIEARKYPIFRFDKMYPAYQSCLKELGLMDSETALGIVYFYGNLTEFEKAQSEFIDELPKIENTNMVGNKATNLVNHEDALMSHAMRLVPLLARQSKALPFTPDAG